MGLPAWEDNYGAIGAENTAVSDLRSQHCTTLRAVVEVDARIGRHGMASLETCPQVAQVNRGSVIIDVGGRGYFAEGWHELEGERDGDRISSGLPTKAGSS